MELKLTDDQELFVETTRRFLETEMPLTRVRELADDPGGFTADYWQRGAELGWTAALVPEALGGGSVSGRGLLDLVLVAEEMGRLVSPGPLVPVNVVASALGRAGAPGDLRDVLDGLLNGRLIATWAIAEGDRSWRGSDVEFPAIPSGPDWILSGRKSYVQDAVASQWLLVTARTGGGLSQFLVDKDSPGVTLSPLQSLDLVHRFAHVSFDDVRVPGSAVVGEIGEAAAEAEHQLQTALALQCAESAGAAAKVFEFTLQYTIDRVSFGRSIGSYQALKHRLADLKMAVEASFATATGAARAVAEEASNASELVSVAKAYIGEQAPAIIQDCVQLHGGIGITWDADLHVYLRRVAQNAALYGTVEQHRDRLADLIAT